MENFEITYEELSKKEKDTFEILDIRDKNSFEYGHIPGAINVEEKQIESFDFSPQKEFYLYCRAGKISKDLVEKLRQNGVKAFNLEGGYSTFLSKHVMDSFDGNVALKAEESLRKKFHRELLTRFCKAINNYDLVQPNDKIAVCISGGKDSMCMAKLFQEVKRHNKIQFELVFLVMDPGYSKENREMIEKNIKMLNIPATFFETDIFENVFHIEKSPCYVCSRMRRGHLYNKAKELGCNKIALGHHYDDVIETILMGMLYGAQIQTMMPKLHSNNFEGMELIRPMYLIRENDVKRWRDYNGLHFIQCACKFTETCSVEGGNTASKRKTVKDLIKSISHKEHQIEGNIFRSVENVNLSTVISYKDKHGKMHSFLEDYDEENN